MEPDFSGWATKAGLVCSDGRVITPDAFKHQDKVTVPLVWQHGHDNPENVLGYAVLEHRAGEGIYAYGYFNDTKQGQNSKQLVQHKDVKFLSIWANGLREKIVGAAKHVLHGAIKEVSLVLAGANPGAIIDYVSLAHSDGFFDEDQEMIFVGPDLEFQLEHADQGSDGPSVQEIFDSMSEEQQGVVGFLVSEALATAATAAHTDEPKDDKSKNGKTDDKSTDDKGDLAHKDQEGTELMHKNIFESNGKPVTKKDGGTLSHDELTNFAKAVWTDTRKPGMTFRQAILSHAEQYGITNIDVLFPDAKNINNEPKWITRRMEWVEGVLNGTYKLPFARFKSRTADLTLDSARAKGFVKGNIKKEQFFEIAQRETAPFTIYKKQKLDRDDIIDVTDFDVVAWMWVEMRFMLREESARAIMIGDGREIDDPDKINENKIRPIALDDEFYTDVVTVPAGVGGGDLVELALRNRNTYKGAGQPTAYMTNAVFTDMLLTKDKMGRRLYRNKAELSAELNVTTIVEVEVMQGVKRDGNEILMLLVNLADYGVGTDRGGEITTFDDFDIDVNQYKYLIEGRFSGALMSPKTAQVFVRASGATEVTPTVPTFNAGSGVVTIPNTAGVIYKNQDSGATLNTGNQNALAAGAKLSVEAVPADGFYFPHNFDADWDFTRPVA